jgi:hypothetical protein
MTKLFEKITLTTCIETYRDEKESHISALDELISVIQGHCSEVTLIDYALEGNYELVKKKEVK